MPGLHPNTARFHLEALVTAGLAGRETGDRGRPARRGSVYLAVRSDPAGLGWRGRTLLARMRAPVTAQNLEPFAEPGFCDVLGPVVQVGGILAQAARPDPVDQDTDTIGRGGSA